MSSDVLKDACAKMAEEYREQMDMWWIDLIVFGIDRPMPTPLHSDLDVDPDEWKRDRSLKDTDEKELM